MIDPKTIQDLAIASAIAVPITTGIVQVIKTAIPAVVGRYVPAISLTIGIGLGLLFSGANATGAVVGAIVGLSATGLFEISKTTIAGK